jgi:hypothetical protein
MSQKIDLHELKLKIGRTIYDKYLSGKKAELRQLFKSHKIKLSTFWLHDYGTKEARQQIVAYAESLRTQEAANGHQSAN